MYNYIKSHKSLHIIFRTVKRILFYIWARIAMLISGISSRKKFKGIEKYRNSYSGKRCFLVATGPSLTISDLDLIKNEYSFSCNSIIKIFGQSDFRPTFYAIQDNLGFQFWGKEIAKSNMERVFIGINDLGFGKFRIPPKMCYQINNCILFRSNVSYHWYEMNYDKTRAKLNFSDNCEEHVFDGYTIMYSMIQIAIYMGFTELILLGADCDYSQEKMHFVASEADDRNKNNRFEYTNIGLEMIKAYKAASQFANKRGVTVLNATRGGKLDAFKRVILDDVVKNSHNHESLIL